LADVVETQAGQPPTVYGYLQAMWTVALLVLHLGERFGVQASVSSVRRMLHRLGFSWHRPKLWPARRPDSERVIKETRLAEALADPDATLIAVDECECHLLASLRAMWQRIGQQVRLPTPGLNRRRSIFGGLNLRTGAWHYRLADHKRSTDFIAFLVVLLSVYATGTLYVIVDNASIHHSQAMLAWQIQHPRLQLIYLPTYSGHRLNPVEKVWWHLKRCIAANRNFHALPELDAAICRCLDAFQPTVVLRLCNCDVIRRARLTLSPNVDVSFEH
jgi:transposase